MCKCAEKTKDCQAYINITASQSKNNSFLELNFNTLRESNQKLLISISHSETMRKIRGNWEIKQLYLGKLEYLHCISKTDTTGED